MTTTLTQLQSAEGGLAAQVQRMTEAMRGGAAGPLDAILHEFVREADAFRERIASVRECVAETLADVLAEFAGVSDDLTRVLADGGPAVLPLAPAIRVYDDSEADLAPAVVLTQTAANAAVVASPHETAQETDAIIAEARYGLTPAAVEACSEVLATLPGTASAAVHGEAPSGEEEEESVNGCLRKWVREWVPGKLQGQPPKHDPEVEAAVKAALDTIRREGAGCGIAAPTEPPTTPPVLPPEPGTGDGPPATTRTMHCPRCRGTSWYVSAAGKECCPKCAGPDHDEHMVEGEPPVKKARTRKPRAKAARTEGE